MKNLKTNWWLDAILFASFIFTFLLDITGTELHQWAGIVLGAVLLIHLTLHRNWVVTVVERFFSNTTWRARINLIIDGLLAGGFFIIILTGLMISTWLNITFINFDIWKTIHILSSVITLFLVLTKIVLHRKWIVCTAEKHIFQGNVGIINPLPVQFQPTKEQVSRRDFLKISGVVGAASLIGISQLVKLVKTTGDISGDEISNPISEIASNTGAVVEDTISEIPVVRPTILPTTNTSKIQPETACSIRCNKGCSFPGRCRRYTDSTGNNKCDLGECL
jgi:hypothetical protein